MNQVIEVQFSITFNVIKGAFLMNILPQKAYIHEVLMTSPTPMPSGLNFVPKRSPTCAAVRSPSNYYLPLEVSSRFGVRLRQLRKERNLTQLQMAVNFGIDRTFISDVERGRKSISLPMLEVVALGFKLSLSDLLRDI